jgi:hypothetical protein
MENFMKTAHEIARELQASENIKRYHKALSQAMKILYHNIKLENEVKSLPSGLKSFIINNLNAGNSVHVENDVVFKKLKPFSYKNWPTNKGHVMFFSNNILNAIN